MTGIRYNGYLGGKPRAMPPHEITRRDILVLTLPLAAMAIATALALSGASEQPPATATAESELAKPRTGILPPGVLSLINPLDIASQFPSNIIER